MKRPVIDIDAGEKNKMREAELQLLVIQTQW